MRKGKKLSPEKRLRLLFVALGEASLIVLLGAILAATSITSYLHVTSEADEQIAYIENNPNYFFPNGGPQNENGQQPGQGFPQDNQTQSDSPGNFVSKPGEGENPPEGRDGRTPSRDILAGFRFFTVHVNSDGSMMSNTTYNYDYDEQTAVEAANDVLSRNNASGYYGDYRYNVFEVDSGKDVIFLLWSEQLEPTKAFIINSSIGSAIGLVLSSIALVFVSKLAVRPVEIANKKQRQFISDASHELKTPLTIISANNEIIEMTYGEDEATKTIDRQVRKMTSMVRSLTTLSKLKEANRSEFAKVDLSLIYSETVEEFKSTFEHEGKKLSSSIQEGIKVNGIEAELRKMLSTFLDNARKYAKTYCHVTLYKQSGEIVLKCSNDTLVEMEPGDKNEFFERFYRTDDARGSNVEGSGIGLSIAKEIALLHKATQSCYVTKEGEYVIMVKFKA